MRYSRQRQRQLSKMLLLALQQIGGLLSPPIVVYSPRVLPVYVYDANADCGKNVSAAFLVLHGIALVTEGWGVVAILKFLPPFAGASLSAITLVVAFGFAFSRPCLTLKIPPLCVMGQEILCSPEQMS
ncbi:Calpain-type cysteine protease family isoform 5 [Prunus yedoensis var. nudiflora]|uniref:Calpain-type cysteine protease family isoform 5 n=1 Tax=Prunus yedoensis var. nudiflora TaxID=2094558 RepID=A0A314XIR0_PRUYE|nr:Calpain-type cysteine protease family isoform 5 [Prunus yedoensis var. nudiflora]